MRSNVRKMSSPKIDGFNPHMTSLIKETRVIFFLYILEDDIFRVLGRIESNQPYYTTLVLEFTCGARLSIG